MCGELRGLHDRLKATTVYVTHDQTEAMSLGRQDRGHEQWRDRADGRPREIYDRPSSVFVADFIGSPPMNLLTFNGSLEPGRGSVRVGQAEVGIPAPREAMAGRDLVLGVRPEHVRLERWRRCGAKFSGRNTSAPPRSSPSRPQMAWSKRDSHRRSKRRSAIRWASSSGLTASRCSTPVLAVRFAQRSMTMCKQQSPHMSEVTLDGVSKRFGATQAVSDCR